MPSLKGIALKNRNFGEFSPGKEVKKLFLEKGSQGCHIISVVIL
jgi:hypothetical protein